MAWSQDGVKTARRLYGIAGHVRTVEDPEVLTFNGAARYLAVSPTTIKRMVAAGVLSTNQAAPFAPWEIQRSALDAKPVSKVVAHLKKTGRRVVRLRRAHGEEAVDDAGAPGGGDHHQELRLAVERVAADAEPLE